jgi:hypothetical protein
MRSASRSRTPTRARTFAALAEATPLARRQHAQFKGGRTY